MAVSGLPDPCPDHARSIGRLALDMMDNTRHLTDRDGNLIKVGIIEPYLNRVIS